MSAIEDLMGVGVLAVGAGVTMKIVDRALGSTPNPPQQRRQSRKSKRSRKSQYGFGNFSNLGL